ncbi:MAG: hypothetical protein ACE14S_11555 [Candidatus Bathyarchaeia archaeon]
MALNNAARFSYGYSGRQVSNFTVVKDQIRAALLTKSRDKPLVLYPYWQVGLPLDDVYPGSVTMIVVEIWADTSEVIRVYPLGAGGGLDSEDSTPSPSSNAQPAPAQSPTPSSAASFSASPTLSPKPTTPLPSSSPSSRATASPQSQTSASPSPQPTAPSNQKTVQSLSPQPTNSPVPSGDGFPFAAAAVAALSAVAAAAAALLLWKRRK